jgi:hypothetical protein
VRRTLALPLLLALLLLPASARAQYMQISGVVMTSRGTPIPGCVVQLINPDVGPSYPVSTGAGGEYAFPEVPTKVRSLYTLQVRWKDSVIYRGIIRRPGVQPPIVIQLP